MGSSGLLQITVRQPCPRRARADTLGPVAEPGEGRTPVRGRSFDVHLDRFVEQIADYAIIALNLDGVIETWNVGAQRVKGYTAAEAIGCHFAMFYPEEDRRAGLPWRLLQEARTHGRVQHTGWRVRKDGDRFWGDVVITAVHDEEGRHTGFIKVTRDRSDIKRREQAQDAFYSAFSHDFKTPVTAMLGYLDSLRDAPEEARDHLLTRAEANAQRLFEMVDELITIARHRAELSSARIDQIDVPVVVRSALDSLPPGLGGRVQFPTGDAVLARANAIAVQRIVANLVVNALKYSPADSAVLLAVREARTGEVLITVSDQGRGIDPGDLDSIFDAFQRGRLAGDDGGTGLGLASVRALLAQQDGTIHIDSEVGVGTTVTVTLPGVAVDSTACTAPQPGR